MRTAYDHAGIGQHHLVVEQFCALLAFRHNLLDALPHLVGTLGIHNS